MPRTLRETTDNAIWALTSQGFGPAEIARALEEDRAGVGRKVTLTPRTIRRRREILREQGRPEPKPISPADVPDTARAILAAYLGLVQTEIDKLEARQALGETIGAELAKQLGTVRAVAEVARVDVIGTSSRQSRGGHARARKPESALQRLAPTTEGDTEASQTAAENAEANGAGELEREASEAEADTE